MHLAGSKIPMTKFCFATNLLFFRNKYSDFFDMKQIFNYFFADNFVKTKGFRIFVLENE